MSFTNNIYVNDSNDLEHCDDTSLNTNSYTNMNDYHYTSNTNNRWLTKEELKKMLEDL